MVARGMAVLVVFGLLAGPLAVLRCETRDAPAKACCRHDMAHCNQPGKTQDCCRKKTAPNESLYEIARAPRVPGPAPISPIHLTSTAIATSAPAEGIHDAALGRLAPPTPAASPPRAAVLRV